MSKSLLKDRYVANGASVYAPVVYDGFGRGSRPLIKDFSPQWNHRMTAASWQRHQFEAWDAARKHADSLNNAQQLTPDLRS